VAGLLAALLAAQLLRRALGGALGVPPRAPLPPAAERAALELVETTLLVLAPALLRLGGAQMP
jgi:hypothetical protein